MNSGAPPTTAKRWKAFSARLAKTLKPMEEPLQIGDETFIVEFDDQGGILRGTLQDGSEKTWRLRHSFGGRNMRYLLIPKQLKDEHEWDVAIA